MASQVAELLARAVSRLIGWIYTLSWSLSFYPQPLLNYRRRSTTGSTIDFPAINTLGFILLLLSNGLLYYSPLVRAQYAERNPVSPEPTVRANDVAFAAHAVLLSALVLSQFSQKIWGFKQTKSLQRISRPIFGVGLACATAILITVALALSGRREEQAGKRPHWEWLDVVYALGYAKLFISVVKWMPQIVANYRRKSTVGWSVSQITLDFVGGWLSLAQLLIDSSLQNDWSGLTGNPVKLWLGNISIFFDIIFMVQHFLLYRNPRPIDEEIGHDPERRGLLASDDESIASR